MQHSPDIPESCCAPCASAHSAKWDFEDEDDAGSQVLARADAQSAVPKVRLEPSRSPPPVSLYSNRPFATVTI